MRHIKTLIATGAFAAAALLSWLIASWAASTIESRTEAEISGALDAAGHDWATVESDGLRVRLAGTAGSEAERFQALSLAGEIVDAPRLIDAMEVTDPDGLEPPRFSAELLRNDDGVSLIGLLPRAFDRDGMVDRLDRLSDSGDVADMLETADHPMPDGLEQAMAYGLAALESLPRSRVSISTGRVAITALAEDRDSREELERRLRRDAPAGLELALDLSAPRPVITPFTLRFLVDDGGARFDACAADTEAARTRILDAALEAGAPEHTRCTIGIGAPSASWGTAGALAIDTLAGLGAGSVTISDTDISLVATASVPEDRFDRLVGELEADLPDVFSLEARLEQPRDSETERAPRVSEFVATLSANGEVELRGRLPDAALRDVVESYAQSRFGMNAVYNAARLEPALPEGWALRVLAGLEALAELHEGRLRVGESDLELTGRTANRDSTDVVARLFGEKLGRGAEFSMDLDYDATLAPLQSEPTPQLCLAEIEAVLAEQQITFEPGSSDIAPEAESSLDTIAAIMRECGAMELEVAGHTDSDGSAALNEALSQARAETVITELMSRRVLVAGLTARGYGEGRPIASNATAGGRAQNRRIEFTRAGANQPRERDPELEATLEFEARTPDAETVHPAPRPAGG